jgi:hypothetical protein
VIPATLDNVTQRELQRYENNDNALNLITTVLGRNVYDRVPHGPASQHPAPPAYRVSPRPDMLH